MLYIDYIKLIHGDHNQSSQHKDCSVFEAISGGLPDEYIIKVVEEVDGEIRDDYEAAILSEVI